MLKIEVNNEGVASVEIDGTGSRLAAEAAVGIKCLAEAFEDPFHQMLFRIHFLEALKVAMFDPDIPKPEKMSKKDLRSADFDSEDEFLKFLHGGDDDDEEGS